MHKDKLRIGYNRDLSIKYDKYLKKKMGKRPIRNAKKRVRKRNEKKLSDILSFLHFMPGTTTFNFLSKNENLPYYQINYESVQ